MRHIIILTIFIACNLTIMGKKITYPIEIVAGTADLIVIGEITQVNKTTFNFRIEETIKGQRLEMILVNQLIDWECDTRQSKYASGQRLFLFLSKGKKVWTIINGTTGEIPIIKGELTLMNEEYKHIRYKFNPYKLGLVEFKNGMIGFTSCFKFKGDYDELSFEKQTFIQLCNDRKTTIFWETNRFTVWLHKKIKNYIIERK